MSNKLMALVVVSFIWLLFAFKANLSGWCSNPEGAGNWMLFAVGVCK